MKRNSTGRAVLVLTLIGWLGGGAAIVSHAQTAPATPSTLAPELQDVARLSEKHIGDDVIINYIKASGKTYKLSADDIIILNSQGVSQDVIAALQNATPAGPNPTPAVPAVVTNISLPTSVSSPSVEPPLLEAPSATLAATLPEPIPALPPSASFGLQDNFFADTGLNPSLWQTDSAVLSSLASMYTSHVAPRLAFSSSGMQMSGPASHGQFTGIQSTASFVAPFNFSVTVSGQPPGSIPFEIYLVTEDLKQRLTITGHLGGRGGTQSEISFSAGVRSADTGFKISSSAGYGIWVNHTGSGVPISALGSRFFENPLVGLPYTFQVNAGPDGVASVSVLDSTGKLLASQNVVIGTGPFYVVLGGRNAGSMANWQSVQLTQPGQVAAEAPVASPIPTLDYFRTQLAPYGNWVAVPGYGLCWQPAVSAGWRPYYDDGHWEYTDAGWYWQSDYSWGDIAFHYGRWTFTTNGWLWVPGYDFAPAWVVWRHADADGYVGWAPLPPGAIFINGAWEFNHVRVGADFDFGLSLNFFTFVGYDHFWEHDFRHFMVPGERLTLVYRHSVIENRYQLDHGRIINEGLAHDRVAGLTHREVKVEPMHNLREQEEHQNVVTRRNDIHDFRPGEKPNARKRTEVKSGEELRASQNHQGQPENNRR